VKKKELETDFELNIASIIDCFTVLITYLLLSASFISLGIFDITVPTHTASESAPQPSSEISLSIGVKQNHDIEIEVQGTETATLKVSEQNGKQDIVDLKNQLVKIKEKYPNLESAVISGDDTSLYKELVKTVDTTRKIFPHVALSADLDTGPGT
jgi:biopolymer transport protein ExbD